MISPPAQTELFAGRASKVATYTALPGGGFIESFWTWQARRMFMADFKVRACCPLEPFVPRVLTDVHDRNGKPVFLKDGRTVLQSCTPAYEAFPSHWSHGSFEGYVITGEDGSCWTIGSQGNALPVLRREVIGNPRLTPDEKMEVLRWLDGDRTLNVTVDDLYENKTEDAYIAHFVEKHFIQRIQAGPTPSEEGIRSSGLPEEVIKNLLYNRKNFKPVLIDAPADVAANA